MIWLQQNAGMLWGLTLVHAGLSIPPIILGFVVSLPLGWLAYRFRVPRHAKIAFGGVVLTAGGLLYAIPSLALFMVLPGILGTSILDPVNVEVALTLYAIALMVRTTADALASVEPDVRDSSKALGLSGWQSFWRVELPLAGGPLLAGLRVVSVSTVSLLSVAAVIGVNTLGYLFLDGLQRDFPLEVSVGIVGSVVVAAVFDAVLVLVGRLAMPWQKALRESRLTGVGEAAAS
ncbi:MAG TPA: ABC transporter permease subunit [Microbacteriaceae bacterium]|nr:ABC transporter permease subunit [Microbacteriaceae bacterium]